MDVAMFALLAGRERMVEDYRRLLAEVDSRLVLRRARCPDGSASTIEISG